MSLEHKAIVGAKGEILPRKKLREIAGINPGDQVMVIAKKNEFLIRKILTVDDAFNLPIIDSDTPENLKKQIKNEISLGLDIGI